MGNNKFVLIAATLGLSVPATLLGFAVDAEAKHASSRSLHESISKHVVQNSVHSENPITKRMLDLFEQNKKKESGNYVLHTDSYTDTGGSHTDYTTPADHTDQHSDYSNENMCPVEHTDYHSNYGNSYPSHTNYGTPHTDNHSNYSC